MGVNEYIQIGSRIKEIRKSLGISQREIANRLNLPFSTYSNYENNNREPSFDTIKKIADALGVSVAEIMQWTKFDTEYDSKKLSDEVKLLENIQNIFGKSAEKLLEAFLQLNTKGKEKAIDNITDLTLIDTYTKKD